MPTTTRTQQLLQCEHNHYSVFFAATVVRSLITTRHRHRAHKGSTRRVVRWRFNYLRGFWPPLHLYPIDGSGPAFAAVAHTWAGARTRSGTCVMCMSCLRCKLQAYRSIQRYKDTHADAHTVGYKSAYVRIEPGLRFLSVKRHKKKNIKALK